jgi:hypothetical protein
MRNLSGIHPIPLSSNWSVVKSLINWIGDHHANYLQKQIDRGRLLFWARTRHSAIEEHAIQILKRHSGGEVHVHALPAAAAIPT